MPRPIDADSLLDKVLRHYTEQEKKGNLSFVACEIKQSFADMVSEAPTLTADDYFDAVDRIKPCPNCRYALLGALTEDEPRWIPVTERLPEKNGNYIVTACDEGCSYGEGIWYSTVVVVAEYYNGAWTWYEGSTEYDLEGIVTHWMQLPTPPKEEI